MRAFVDRIDGDRAVLLLGENEEVQIALPMNWLPKETMESTVLRLDLSIDESVMPGANPRLNLLRLH